MIFEVNCRTNGYCGKCCYETEMPLTAGDIERIKALGFDEDDFSVVVEGVRRLRNVKGACYFLKDNKCTIYENRPIGCRIYPLVLDEDGKVVVDEVCPLKDEIEAELTPKIVERAAIALRKIVEEVYGSRTGI
ncbi:YkgJ family cysteine cluster protein [Archaeoglobales archaeon]|nr:MAG: YkgJ family cysteine cluster protein [Archaeoglobales archaeon]